MLRGSETEYHIFCLHPSHSGFSRFVIIITLYYFKLYWYMLVTGSCLSNLLDHEFPNQVFACLSRKLFTPDLPSLALSIYPTPSTHCETDDSSRHMTYQRIVLATISPALAVILQRLILVVLYRPKYISHYDKWEEGIGKSLLMSLQPHLLHVLDLLSAQHT